MKINFRRAVMRAKKRRHAIWVAEMEYLDRTGFGYYY